MLQQVDTPKKLYEEPVNLFVAGFIGSPAMNFFPAELKGSSVSTPFGDIPLPARLQGVAQRAGSGRVIAGLRPESFEDAEIARRQGRSGGHEFEADVDLIESMGSEVYAYLRLEGSHADSADLADLAADSGAADVPGAGTDQLVTRLSAETGIRARHPGPLLAGHREAPHLRRRQRREPGPRGRGQRGPGVGARGDHGAGERPRGTGWARRARTYRSAARRRASTSSLHSCVRSSR